MKPTDSVVASTNSPVVLASLLSKGLVDELLDGLAHRRTSVSLNVQRHASALMASLLKQPGVHLGGAKTPEAIHPVAIKKSQLVRQVLADGGSQCHVACMVWVESHSALEQAARALAKSRGQTSTSFVHNHLHPAKWDPVVLQRMAEDLAKQVSGCRLEQAKLMLFVICEDTRFSSCDPPSVDAPVRVTTPGSAPVVVKIPAIRQVPPSPPRASPPIAPPAVAAVRTTGPVLGASPDQTPQLPLDKTIPPPAEMRQAEARPKAVQTMNDPVAATPTPGQGQIPPGVAGDKKLSARNRETLRDSLRDFQLQLGIGPLREAAKDAGLLGKEARNLDGAALKRVVADSDQLARLVGDALEDRSRQAGALRTLQKIALRAQQDPGLDPRAQNYFQRARRALESRDLESQGRAFDGLRALSSQIDHTLLLRPGLVVLLSTGDLDRVRFGLEEPDSVAGDGGGAKASSKPARERAEAPSRSAPVAVAASKAGADAQIELYRERVARGIVRAKAAAERQLPNSTYSDALALFKSSVANSAQVASEKGTGAQQLEAQLGGAVAAISSAASALVSAAKDVQAEAESVDRDVAVALGDQSPTALTLDAAMRPPGAYATRIQAAETEAQVTLAEVEVLNTSVNVDLPVVPPTDRGVFPALVELRALRDALIAASARAASAAKQHAEKAAAVARDVPMSPEPARALRFRSARVTEASTVGGLVGKLRSEAKRTLRAGPIDFLPVPAPEVDLILTEAGPGTSVPDAANIAARNLVQLWARELRFGSRPVAQYVEFINESGKLRDAVSDDPAVESFDRVVVALAMQSASEDRGRARGHRRLVELLACDSSEAVDQALGTCTQAAAMSPVLSRISAELLGNGFGKALAHAVTAVSLKSPADGRRLLDALAIAVALGDKTAGRACRIRVLEGLGAGTADTETIEDFLTDTEAQSRRTARPDVPRLTSTQPLVTDFVAALAHRNWEKGRSAKGQAKVVVSIPKSAQKGLTVEAGSRNLEVPIMVRNGGDIAAGGVSVLINRPLKGDSPLKGDGAELHVPWLSDQNLEDTAAVVVASTLEVDPERLDAFRELRLSLRTSWFGGRSEETYVIPLRFDRPTEPPIEMMNGYDGFPVNLNDSRNLGISSTSVQKCFTSLRDALRQGRPLRAFIYGRRRRGKSSICTSLRDDQEIQGRFAVQDKSWNGARMTSAATALATLADVLLAALAKTGVSRAQLDLSDLTRAEEISQRFLFWFDNLGDSLRSKTPVLLILDEFQKWLSGLASPQERLALLAALRHFNDRKSNLEVSVILSGLQNLRALIQESNDLANALEPFEIKALTNEEADRYLRERLPIELDGRTRRRLISLSGGNPYVLNRLGGNLLDALKEKRRRWCNAADVDNLMANEDAQTGKLNEFLKYMLHEDEDDGAATLRQLTVLRATASLLQERGDYDGYVRSTDVEDWLSRNSIGSDPGVVERHLEELAHLDLIQLRPGGRYSFRGEWLCRALAALDPGVVKLQQVTEKGDPDLVLGRYHRKTLLGHGGEAEIWLASNVQEGGLDVVLRIYPQNTVGLQQRIDREREILEKVHHTNVVAFRGASIDPRHGGIVVLDYISGQTLEEVLRSTEPGAASILPGGDLTRQVELLGKVTGAVRACHEAGVIHKDLSPRNIMLSQQFGVWEPKLIDFGIAGFDTQPVPGAQTTVLGTPGYVAPEKIKLQSARRTPAADIYSLGALFVRVLSGVEPGEFADFGPPLETALLDRGIPRRLIDLVQRMVSLSPKERPSANEVETGLETVLEPLTWRELRAHATQAYLEDRTADAERLFGQALAAVSASERSGDEYEKLLEEALDAFPVSAGGCLAWDKQWLSHWLELARGGAALKPDGVRVLKTLLQYRRSAREAGLKLLGDLVFQLGDAPTSPNLAAFVASLARQEEFRESSIVDKTFDALASYCAENRLEANVVEDFCIVCARNSRVKYQNLIGAELWLQRARRVSGSERSDYLEESKVLDDARKRTGKRQTLPPLPPKQEEFRFGEDEKGHLNVERISRFDENVRRRFPFVRQLVRVTKDPRLQAGRPTLLGLDNLASHLPHGRSDPGNIIPLALDATYTGDIVLRVNIVLIDGTTAAQRQAAYNELRVATDLFDSPS